MLRVRVLAPLVAGLSLLAPLSIGRADPAPAPSSASPLLPRDAAIPPTALEAVVDATVRQTMEREHIAGVTVSVVQDGKAVLKKGYGFADVARQRPVDPDRTLFRIGSITKTFTRVMTLKAVDRGHMRLDAPVNSYLPPKVRVPDRPGYRQITLHDLMTHTAGFEDLPLKHLFLRDPAELQPMDDDLALHRPARVFPPGAVTAYSNYGVSLVGDALAHAEGQDWPDLLETEILKPAGMGHSTGRELYPARPGLPAPMPADLARDLSQPYRWSGVGYRADPFELLGGMAPAGAISSTAGDMARYMTLLLGNGTIDGRTIYSPDTAAALRTPLRQYLGDDAIDGGFFQSALGDGLMSYGHNGATMDFHSNLMIVPALRLGVFVASNTEGEQHLVGVLPALIVQTFYQAPHAPLPPAPALLRDAAAYRGEYLSSRRPFHGLEAFATGFLATSVSVAPPGYLVMGGERFVPTARANVFQDVDHPWVQIQAVIDHGHAQRLILQGGELWRRDAIHRNSTLALATGLTVLAAVGVLFGLCSPARWRLPQTSAQRLAGALRGPAAALWLVAIPTFVLKLQAALADQSTIVYGWPGPLTLTASTAALAAAVLSWGALALTPFAWVGRDGWSAWRKLRFSGTVLVFAAFGALLALLGALQPWNP